MVVALLAGMTAAPHHLEGDAADLLAFDIAEAGMGKAPEMMHALDVERQHPAEIGFGVAVIEIQMVHPLALAVEKIGMGRAAGDDFDQFHFAGAERRGGDAEAGRRRFAVPRRILGVDLVDLEWADAEGVAIEFDRAIYIPDHRGDRTACSLPGAVGFLEGIGHRASPLRCFRRSLWPRNTQFPDPTTILPRFSPIGFNRPRSSERSGIREQYSALLKSLHALLFAAQSARPSPRLRKVSIAEMTASSLSEQRCRAEQRCRG